MKSVYVTVVFSGTVSIEEEEEVGDELEFVNDVFPQLECVDWSVEQ